CLYNKCSHICLPSDDNRIYRCVCPKDTVLIDGNVCGEKRFETLVVESMHWEKDLQNLIKHSIRKSMDLRRLLNQSFEHQMDLNHLFDIYLNDSFDMKTMFRLNANHRLSMKKGFIKSINETLFWRHLFDQTFRVISPNNLTLNESYNSDNLTQMMDFLESLMKSEDFNEYWAVDELRVGQLVIHAIILIALLVSIETYILQEFIPISDARYKSRCDAKQT
ncbi:unnamed protein product, partial [Medioppia subpectinata]